MLASSLPHSIKTSHGLEPNTGRPLVPIKLKAKILQKLNYNSKDIRQQFSIRLHYFLNSSYLHGVRFLDRQYGAIDRWAKQTKPKWESPISTKFFVFINNFLYWQILLDLHSNRIIHRNDIDFCVHNRCICKRCNFDKFRYRLFELDQHISGHFILYAKLASSESWIANSQFHSRLLQRT